MSVTAFMVLWLWSCPRGTCWRWDPLTQLARHMAWVTVLGCGLPQGCQRSLLKSHVPGTAWPRLCSLLLPSSPHSTVTWWAALGLEDKGGGVWEVFQTDNSVLSAHPLRRLLYKLDRALREKARLRVIEECVKDKFEGTFYMLNSPWTNDRALWNHLCALKTFSVWTWSMRTSLY